MHSPLPELGGPVGRQAGLDSRDQRLWQRDQRPDAADDHRADADTAAVLPGLLPARAPHWLFVRSAQAVPGSTPAPIITFSLLKSQLSGTPDDRADDAAHERPASRC